MEIIVVDGGSCDNSVEIARTCGVEVIMSNQRRSGEAGKAIGSQSAHNEIVAFIDSDNILPCADWLRRMVRPFRNPIVVAAEPLFYTFRKKDPIPTQYCALLGMNDPLCLYLGNYDRYSYVTGRWTDLPVSARDCGSYLLLDLDERNIPTIGANGFLIRTNALNKLRCEKFLFDVDVVYQLVRNGRSKIAKVRVGIVHLFANGATAFTRKTYRRIRDYLYYRRLGARRYPWRRGGRVKLAKFVLRSFLVFPTVVESLKGYKTCPETAFLFHPIACLITLYVYGLAFLAQLISE